MSRHREGVQERFLDAERANVDRDNDINEIDEINEFKGGSLTAFGRME